MCRNKSKNCKNRHVPKLKDYARKWSSPKKPQKNSHSNQPTKEWSKPTAKECTRAASTTSHQPQPQKFLGIVKKVHELLSLRHNIRWHLRRGGKVAKVVRWRIKPQHQAHNSIWIRKKENYQNKVWVKRQDSFRDLEVTTQKEDLTSWTRTQVSAKSEQAHHQSTPPHASNATTSIQRKALPQYQREQ